MVLFYTFFFVFSLRLGGVIIGTLTLLKSSVWLILQVWALESLTEFSNLLKDAMHDQFIFGDLAEWLDLYKNLKYYVIGLAVFYGLEIVICIFLLIGTYQCYLNFIYPFLWSYIFYFLLVWLELTVLYLILKIHNDGVGFTIGYVSIGFFILVYCIYGWCCIFSLVDVIKILQSQVLQKIKPQGLKSEGNIPRVKKIEFRKVQVRKHTF